MVGSSNLQHQWRIRGEFSNYPQEQLIEWIQANTEQSTTAILPRTPVLNFMFYIKLHPILSLFSCCFCWSDANDGHSEALHGSPHR